MITFEEFKEEIRAGELSGEIETPEPITDYDLAVLWAVGTVGDKKGYPCEITPREIWDELFEICEPELIKIVTHLGDTTVKINNFSKKVIDL